MEPTTKPTSIHKNICTYLKNDLTTYLKEFTCSTTKTDPQILQAIKTTVETQCLVVFTKPGCGFCKRAKALLSEHYTNENIPLVEINGATKPYRVALAHVLGTSIISFPMVYINGNFVGGSDDVLRLHNQDQIHALIRGPRKTMPPFGQGILKTKPLFTTQLAGSEILLREGGPCDSSSAKWYLFQTKSYAQVIRMMSVFHVALLLLMLACGESNSLTGVTIGLVIAGVLCVDLSLYVCFGATPLTVFGNISKWLVWNVKGDAVPAIPYKVVFLVYVLALGRMLLTCTAYDNSLLCWQNNTEEYRGALIGGVVNSGALAVFRF